MSFGIVLIRGFPFIYSIRGFWLGFSQVNFFERWLYRDVVGTVDGPWGASFITEE
jgi:hypothetical protein